MAKKKNFKHSNKKKQRNTTHPYIELLQTEIVALEEKMNSFENIDTELTSEQETEKLVTKACLERYQDTINKTTEAPILNKLNIYNTSIIDEAKKKQELQFLTTMQLFYLMRLGQLGLFQFMDPNAVVPLESIADLCDQMIGAAVHFANTPSTSLSSSKSRSKYKSKVFQLIQKLDISADEPVHKSEDENGDKTTFKQVKALLDHLWENTHTLDVTETPKDFNVLQFDTMMPTQRNTTTDIETADVSEYQEEQVVTSKTSLSITSITTHEEKSNIDVVDNTNKKQEEKEHAQIEEIDTGSGWGTSEDPTRKSAWGSNVPDENTPSNTLDHVQSTEKPHNKNLNTSESSTSSSTTKSIGKREKDVEKKRRKRDTDKKKSELKKLEEKKPDETIEKTDVPTEEVTTLEHKDELSTENNSSKESTKDDNWIQKEEPNGWTISDTIVIKEGGWDDPDDKATQPETKDWEELKNNFGSITLSEDPMTKTDMNDDGWKHGYNSRGRGRGRGNGSRGRGNGSQSRGTYRGSNRGRGNGRGDFNQRRYDQQ